MAICTTFARLTRHIYINLASHTETGFLANASTSRNYKNLASTCWHLLNWLNWSYVTYTYSRTFPASSLIVLEALVIRCERVGHCFSINCGVPVIINFMASSLQPCTRCNVVRILKCYYKKVSCVDFDFKKFCKPNINKEGKYCLSQLQTPINEPERNYSALY